MGWNHQLDDLKTQKNDVYKADVWSFGCTALESSTAQPPWGKGAIDGMLSAVKRLDERGLFKGKHGGGGDSYQSGISWKSP